MLHIASSKFNLILQHDAHYQGLWGRARYS